MVFDKKMDINAATMATGASGIGFLGKMTLPAPEKMPYSKEGVKAHLFSAFIHEITHHALRVRGVERMLEINHREHEIIANFFEEVTRTLYKAGVDLK